MLDYISHFESAQAFMVAGVGLIITVAMILHKIDKGEQREFKKTELAYKEAENNRMHIAAAKGYLGLIEGKKDATDVTNS